MIGYYMGDVWLKFESEGDENPTYEASTFRMSTGEAVVEYYHHNVGQVTEIEFDNYSDAVAWYERNGYVDYTA